MANNIIQAKKHLGQNFLKNTDILKKIVGGNELAGQNVIEVGPGPGDLTHILQEQGANSLTLIEIDKDMMPLLQMRFHEKDIAIYLSDVLRVNIISGQLITYKGICIHENQYTISLPSYHLYGNIPYYITSPIIHHFFYEVSLLPETATFTMQKEVADRILVRDKKHSVLSVSCHLVAEIEKVCDINPNSFTPVPKVWSTCLRFHIRKNTSPEKNKKIMKLVELGFSQKRKKLISNLQNNYPKIMLSDIFNKIEISQDIRAEDVTINQWIMITDLIP